MIVGVHQRWRPEDRNGNGSDYSESDTDSEGIEYQVGLTNRIEDRPGLKLEKLPLRKGMPVLKKIKFHVLKLLTISILFQF